MTHLDVGADVILGRFESEECPSCHDTGFVHPCRDDGRCPYSESGCDYCRRPCTWCAQAAVKRPGALMGGAS